MLAMVLAGCGAGAPAGNGAQSARTTNSRPLAKLMVGGTSLQRRPAWSPENGSAPARGAQVGATQRVQAGDSTLSVTVSRVIDPLLGSGASLVPSARAVGVRLTIRDDGGATYDSTASGDVSIIASSGAAAPVYISSGVCRTPLVDFESLLAVGDARSGCVGFELARGARILAVRFSPHSREPGSVTWTVTPHKAG